MLAGRTYKGKGVQIRSSLKNCSWGPKPWNLWEESDGEEEETAVQMTMFRSSLSPRK